MNVDITKVMLGEVRFRQWVSIRLQRVKWEWAKSQYHCTDVKDGVQKHIVPLKENYQNVGHILHTLNITRRNRIKTMNGERSWRKRRNV